jgi:hypothetical protein
MQATAIEAYTQRIQPLRIHRTIPRGDRTPRAPRRPGIELGLAIIADTFMSR